MRRSEKIHDCENCSVCEVSLFKTMEVNSLRKLSSSKSESVYKKGQIIFNELNSPDGIYAIAKGSVKIYKEGKEGKEQILKFAGTGAVLGYRALLCDEPFGVSAAALEDVNLCFIPHKIFKELLLSDARFSQQMLKELSTDLGASREKVVGLTQKSVKERIAETLLNLKSFYGENEEDSFLTKKVSRTHVAQLCGATLESTVRALKELDKEGLITLDKMRVKVNNPSRLAQIAGIDF